MMGQKCTLDLEKNFSIILFSVNGKFEKRLIKSVILYKILFSVNLPIAAI